MSHSAAPAHLRIGIVGAGNIGEPLARLWTQAGHTVKIANSRGPETLTEVAQRTGATAATAEDAVKEANVVVVTIPQKNIPLLGGQKLISQLSADTIVIETGNYYPHYGAIAELESDNLAESKWVQQQLGHPVIKAFNNITSHSFTTLGKPANTADRIALPVAGDNAAHKATLIALLDQIGFDSVDAGSLDESWRQQPGTPVYCTDYDVEGVKRALSRADRSRTRTVRDAQMGEFMKVMATNPSPSQIPAFAREFMGRQYGQ